MEPTVYTVFPAEQNVRSNSKFRNVAVTQKLAYFGQDIHIFMHKNGADFFVVATFATII